MLEENGVTCNGNGSNGGRYFEYFFYLQNACICIYILFSVSELPNVPSSDSSSVHQLEDPKKQKPLHS